jgi:hypothetical protein
MKAVKPQKIFSIIVCLCYFTTQIALGNQAESNVWSERRKAASTQLASLPAAALLPQRFSAVKRPILNAARLERTTDKPLADLIDALPLTHSTIQDIFSPENAASPPIAIIQDVHMNVETQTNIAAVLQKLIDKNQAGSVGVAEPTPAEFLEAEP